MICPECRQPITEKEVITSDNQKAVVYECFNCGGHFIPPLVANLIPMVTAQDLDSIAPKNTYPLSPSVICPVCQATLVAITDEVVPRGVTVYSCPNNHGNYFPLHQLYAFKNAQKAKLQYHQLWGIPVKSVFAILLPVIAVFTAITAIPFTLQQIRTSQEQRVKASEIVSAPLVTPISGSKVVISFSTSTAVLSNLRLLLPNNPLDIPGSTSPQTTHVITLNNLQSATSYQYLLIINGQEYGPYSFSTPASD